MVVLAVVVLVEGRAALAAADVLVAVAVDEEEAGQVADGSDDGGQIVAAGPEAFVGGGVAEDLFVY